MKKEKQILSKLVVINFAGKDGNIFNLIAEFRTAALEQDIPEDDIKLVIHEIFRSHSYDEALCILLDNSTSNEDI